MKLNLVLFRLLRRKTTCKPWRLQKMKDIDIGKEYIIPSPGYRSVRERADSVQHEEQEGSKFQHAKHKVSLSCHCFAVRAH